VRALFAARVRVLLHRRRRVQSHGDAGAVHDLRVATRRLQEALDIFASVLPPRERDRLRRRSRRVRRRMAAVRDADVLIDLVHGLRSRAGASSAAALAPLERRLLARRERLRGALSAAREGAAPGRGLRVPGVLKRARALVGATAAIDGARAARAADRALTARVREVRVALRRARTGRAAEMHRLRIAIKRYRYALETLEACGDRGLTTAVEAARELQGTLGRLHDLDVLIAEARLLGGAGAALPALRALRREEAVAAMAAVIGFRPVAMEDSL
jgi:CHAD domain-containing protein